MARIRSKAVVIDTAKLADELHDLARETRAQVAELARQSLQAQIDAINSASTNRSSAVGDLAVSSGTVNKPLDGATVVVEERRSSAGTRGARLVVFVRHDNGNGENIFNILDSGRKPGIVKEGFVFPGYEGELIPIDPGIGDPDLVKNLISSGNVKVERALGRVIMRARRAGDFLAGFSGKHLYEAAALWTKGELVGRQIVNRKRQTSVRLKKDDVIISVPGRRVFKV